MDGERGAISSSRCDNNNRSNSGSGSGSSGSGSRGSVSRGSRSGGSLDCNSSTSRDRDRDRGRGRDRAGDIYISGCDDDCEDKLAILNNLGINEDNNKIIYENNRNPRNDAYTRNILSTPSVFTIEGRVSYIVPTTSSSFSEDSGE